MTAQPWHQTTLRWAQTDITEVDPDRYDTGWWRSHWKRTRVQGAIVNAAGIVATTPPRYRFTTAPTLWVTATRPYGEIAAAAKDRGMASSPEWTRTAFPSTLPARTRTGFVATPKGSR